MLEELAAQACGVERRRTLCIHPTTLAIRSHRSCRFLHISARLHTRPPARARPAGSRSRRWWRCCDRLGDRPGHRLYQTTARGSSWLGRSRGASSRRAAHASRRVPPRCDEPWVSFTGSGRARSRSGWTSTTLCSTAPPDRRRGPRPVPAPAHRHPRGAGGHVGDIRVRSSGGGRRSAAAGRCAPQVEATCSGDAESAVRVDVGPEPYGRAAPVLVRELLRPSRFGQDLH